MKKMEALLLAGVLLFVVTACGTKEETPIAIEDIAGQQGEENSSINDAAEDNAAVNGDSSVGAGTAANDAGINKADGSAGANAADGAQNAAVQMEVIAQNQDMWYSSPDFADEVYQYAVTDLNQDGRYELIVSNMGGTGSYTYSRFFEVSESYDGLVECTTNFQEGDSQVDIMVESTSAYFDEEAQNFYYIFEDYLKVSAAEYYESIRALTLQGGQIIEENLAGRSEIYTFTGEEQQSGEVSFYDAGGNALEESDYQTIQDTVFSGMKKYQASFGWQDMRELENLSKSELVQKLEQSREAFGVS